MCEPDATSGGPNFGVEGKADDSPTGDSTTAGIAATFGADTHSTEATTSSAVVETPARIAPLASPRTGSKLAAVLRLLARAGGASIDELTALTDWVPHTTRAALTSLRKRGYEIERSREEKLTRYRLRSSAIQESTASPRSERPATLRNASHSEA